MVHFELGYDSSVHIFQALVEVGVDYLGFETIPAQAEGDSLLELLSEFPNQKAWLSFSCRVSKDLDDAGFQSVSTFMSS